MLEDDIGQRPDAFNLFQGVIGCLGIGLINGQPVPLQALAFRKNVGGEFDKVEFDYKKYDLID